MASGRRARGLVVVAVLAAGLAWPHVVAARQAMESADAADAPQVRRPAPVRPPPVPSRPPGFRAFAMFDSTRMAAAKTFDGVLGSAQLSSYGAGAEVVRLWRGTFARFAISRMSREGGRVVVFDGEAIPVGVPTSVKMMPIEAAGGWRFGRGGRTVPYGGGGLLRLSYEETTDFDAPTADTSATFMGSLLFGGLDIQLGKTFGVGAEMQYRRLANAIGESGASGAFNEHDLGGLTLRIWIGIGR